jgi:hypothetical protein
MKLRLPEEMRDRIAELAKQNGRSMNAEIVQRLEESLSTSVPPDLVDTLVRLTMSLAVANAARLGAETETTTVVRSLRLIAQRVLPLVEETDPGFAEEIEVMLHEAEELVKSPSEIQKRMMESMAATRGAMSYFGRLRGGEHINADIKYLMDDAESAMQPKRG